MPTKYSSKYRMHQNAMPDDLKTLIQVLAKSKKIQGNELVKRAVLCYANFLKLPPRAQAVLDEYLAAQNSVAVAEESFEAQVKRLKALHAQQKL